MENDVLYNRIMNVVHEEYGDGSTAVANPEGEPTDSLEKIQIGDDIYSISGGGGGTDRFFEVHFDEDNSTLDKTWQEIFDAIEDGMIPFYINNNAEPGFQHTAFYHCDIAIEAEGIFSVYFYYVTFYSGSGRIEAMPFSTNSANGYPVWED